MGLLKSNNNHLGYQIADYQSRQASQLLQENALLNQEVGRLKEEENKSYWRDYYKDKYKSQNISNQISDVNNMLEMKDTLIRNQMISATNSAINPLSSFQGPVNYMAAAFGGSPLMHPWMGGGGGVGLPNSPYYFHRNPTYDYLNTQNKLFL